MMELGLLAHGDGESALAREWWERAAEGGNAPAMGMLGLTLQEQGDLERAKHWYARGAAAGNAAGMNNLALICEAEGDNASAKLWFERAAASGLPEALGSLTWTALLSGHPERGCDYFERFATACFGPVEQWDQAMTSSWANANVFSNDALNRLATGGSPSRALDTWALTAKTGHSDSLLFPIVLSIQQGDQARASSLRAHLTFADIEQMREDMASARDDAVTGSWARDWFTDCLRVVGVKDPT
ncbi:MAG: hypothetical protein NTU77_01900 [Actinobacteria bacterium]|nr:hypothetical protein [Actinomycetota bacterium]